MAFLWEKELNWISCFRDWRIHSLFFPTVLFVSNRSHDWIRCYNEASSAVADFCSLRVSRADSDRSVIINVVVATTSRSSLNWLIKSHITLLALTRLFCSSLCRWRQYLRSISRNTFIVGATLAPPCHAALYLFKNDDGPFACWIIQ